MLKIDKEQLLVDKSELDSAKNEFDQIVEKMQNIINRLPDSWQGQSADKYVEQFTEIRTNVLNNVSQTIEGISNQIKQVCDNAEEFDGSMADDIN